MPTSRLDFLKALVERGRACCNSIASRKADGMDAHQIRTEATDGANLKWFRGDSVVWSCSGELIALRPGSVAWRTWVTWTWSDGAR